MIRKKLEMLALAAMLSVSMATTALPVTTWAAETTVTTETEDTVTTLTEGTYTVPASLMNASDLTKASMAASVIGGDATVVVSEDGTQTVTLPITSVTVFGMTAYCNDWKLYTEGSISGEKTAIEQYTTGEDGNMNSITFVVPDTTLGGVYVNMTVEITAGSTMSPDAFIKLDYANAKEVINTESLAAAVNQANELKEADYTIASWTALQEKLTAAQAQLDAPESQKACDAAEAALKEAVEALVLQTGIGSANTALDAGVYTLPASLMNASDIEKASMAAGCIAGDATLTVAADGTLKVTVPIQAITVFGVTANASDFKIYAGAVGTETTDAEFTTDADGNVDSITFTIPNKAADGVYMNMVSMAGRTSDAFLKFDYAAATKVVNTDALASAIEAAQALNSGKYTADSWKAVEAALKTANEALTAKESQEAVDAAAAALNKAVKGLKENPKTQKLTGTASYTKAYSTTKFTLNTKTNGNGKLTYKSSNTSVATVSSTGKVTLKGVGQTTITVTAAATSTYTKATKKITVTVKPAANKLSSVKNLSGKKVKVTYTKSAKATNYQIQYSTNSSFKNAKYVTVKGYSVTTKTISKLTKGKTYYVRVRGYKKVSGKTYCGAWSAKKSVKITK